MIKYCTVCGKEFKTNSRQKIYCSEDCYEERAKERRRGYQKKESKGPLQMLKCKTCGKEFKQKCLRQVFCSAECKKNLEIIKTCPICGREFKTNQQTRMYCYSPECAQYLLRKRNAEYQKKRKEEKKQQKQKSQRVPRKVAKPKKTMTLVEINEKARELGMSYGEYVARYGG